MRLGAVVPALGRLVRVPTPRLDRRDLRELLYLQLRLEDRVIECNLLDRILGRRQHMGNELSGGEQQMLAIGRALMTNPKLLILDEATEGLAPMLRLDIWKCLARLKDEGQAILIVDKHLSALVKLADRHTIIEKGYVVWSGTSAALDQKIVQRYLQV